MLLELPVQSEIYTDFSQLFKLPKATENVIEVLTDDGIKHILHYFNLDTAIGCRNYIRMSLVLDSGLRLSEIVRLEIDDLYIESCYIKVSGKGDKERIVPIGVHSQKAMLKHLNFLRPQPALESIKSVLLSTDSTGIIFFVYNGKSGSFRSYKKGKIPYISNRKYLLKRLVCQVST